MKKQESPRASVHLAIAASALLVLFPVGLLAQTGLAEVATVAKTVDAVAEVARQRDIVWLAIVSGIVGMLLAGWLVVVVVRILNRYADLVEKGATAEANTRAELAAIRRAITRSDEDTMR